MFILKLKINALMNNNFKKKLRSIKKEHLQAITRCNIFLKNLQKQDRYIF
jgi:hypothetical protein